MTQSAFFRFLTYRLEHHVYLSIFGLILTRTYIVTTIYTPEHRRARIHSNSPDHHKQFFTPVYISISCHPLFLKFCDIYLFPCFCPICVNLFLMSNVCLFPMYAHFIFLLAVVIAFVLHYCIC